jgi:PAS domain-containing protein
MPVPSGDSSSLLQLIFDHAGEGISVFDAQMRLKVHNQRFLEFTGLPAALACPGADLLVLLTHMARAGEFGHFAGEAELQADCQRRLAELRGGPPGLTQRLRPNGQTLELRRSPTPDGGFVMLYADISQRRAAEDSALQQQRMLQLVQQHTAQGFWFIDNERRTLDANPAMCRMLGVERGELLGRDIYGFVDEANTARSSGATPRCAHRAWPTATKSRCAAPTARPSTASTTPRRCTTSRAAVSARWACSPTSRR